MGSRVLKAIKYIKKRIGFLILFCVLILCSSCGTNKDKEIEIPDEVEEPEEVEESNAVVNNYYIAFVNFAVQVIKFGDDDTIEWVDCGLGRDEDKRTKSYGIYEIDGKKLTITMPGQEELVGIVDDELAISFGDYKFEQVEKESLAEATQIEFE